MVDSPVDGFLARTILVRVVEASTYIKAVVFNTKPGDF